MIQVSNTRLRLTSIDDRPTICHVIHALGVGGAEVLVDQMLRLLSDEFRCVVAVLDEIGEIGERLQRDGFSVEHLHRQPGIDRGCAKRLREFADREGAEILHAHQYTPFFQSMLSRGLFSRRPVVFTEHGRHFPDLPSRRRSVVNRLMLRNCDRLIGCGNAVRQALIVNEGLPESRVEVIYNGVNLKSLGKPSAGARDRIRAEFGYTSTDFVAVLVARLHELKDHQTALRAIDEARKQIPGLRLLLAGDGDQRAAIEQTIRERGLAQTVTLAGTRKDVVDLLAASDVFLLTSISEGIPLTVIEAMAARRPVVSTSVGGLPELVEHGVTGFLAASGDDASLAASLIKLYRCPDLRQRMADIAARRAVEKFSLDGMLNGYRDVYREVLNHGHRQHSPRERHVPSIEAPSPDAASGAGGHS
jgi:glycosyltransferase involved in cell wall biosynthesis